MELELDGHVAVVTGGASGIGLACAQADWRVRDAGSPYGMYRLKSRISAMRRSE